MTRKEGRSSLKGFGGAAVLVLKGRLNVGDFANGLLGRRDMGGEGANFGLSVFLVAVADPVPLCVFGDRQPFLKAGSLGVQQGKGSVSPVNPGRRFAAG